LKKPRDPLGAFAPGTSYWPEFKPLRELAALKQNYMDTEPFKWYALYMQNPVPDEGNIVKFEDFKKFKGNKPPGVSQIVVSIDTAYSEKERADYSAITVWGIFYKNVETSSGAQSVPQMILLYAEKGKWNFHEFCEKMEWLRSESPWKPDYFIIEKASGSVVFIRELYRRQFPLYEFDPKGKKAERLQAASMIIKAGRVWLPVENPEEQDSEELKEWAQMVLDEVCNFPSAPHDDLTDTVAMAILWLRDNGTIHYEAYNHVSEDDLDAASTVSNKPKTYWSAVTENLSFH
jgi:phage terminase large subunit-like protein